MKTDIERLLDAVGIAYSYGKQQTSKRTEPIDTIISWCGYHTEKLPKEFVKSVYAAYKFGRLKK